VLLLLLPLLCVQLLPCRCSQSHHPADLLHCLHPYPLHLHHHLLLLLLLLLLYCASLLLLPFPLLLLLVDEFPAHLNLGLYLP
jgi:hypothetical protein